MSRFADGGVKHADLAAGWLSLAAFCFCYFAKCFDLIFVFFVFVMLFVLATHFDF